MPYGFSFDLSSVPKSFFRELAKVAREKNIHKRMSEKAQRFVKRFKIHELTGLDVAEVLMVIEDLIDVYVRNISEKESFRRTKSRALFLPHCSRKYMDNRCMASFNQSVPSYECAHCSSDCLINRATRLGERRGYDVYVLPGGSCVPEILGRNRYEGVLGVACSKELKLADACLRNMGLAGQAVPLIKNGCANTSFSVESLKRIL